MSKSVNCGERFGTQTVQMLGRVIKFIWIRVDVGERMRDSEESEEVGGRQQMNSRESEGEKNK